MYSLRGVARRIGVAAAMGWVVLLVAGIGCSTAARAATLDPSMLPTIQAATFEVVQAKPTSDPLSYEKPLPLELLPYQERTDKYYSIGTAFSLGNNRYVTAGHVLLAGLGSLWGPPQLRDSAGHVYPIDKIEKFSMGRDFAVFTLAGKPPAGVLVTNTKPALNQVVYAVGNALGTGVVVRDGLYTSDTPEDQDGSWKWMRFSAPASPGNSGGPLLDKDGKVIGVVLMKSPNENLNFGLPIAEVLNAPDGRAIIDQQASYQIDLFDSLQNDRWKAQFALPLPLADFYRAFKAQADANSSNELKKLLAKESANLFPQGEGSTRLLVEQTQLDLFPTLIVRDGTGQWTRVGDAAKRASLDANGYVDLGHANHTMLIHVRRPDHTDAAAFYRDAKVRMDLLAKAGLFGRVVAGERIKVTSLGRPAQETTYTDRWKRTWLVSTWPFPHLNQVAVTYVLPVPDGYVMMMRVAPAAQVDDHRLDLDELASFIYVTYGGTLAQWKEFLASSAPLPPVFHDIHVESDYGHRFAYKSARVAFSFASAVQPVQPDSMLNMGFRFFMDHGQPVWDVGDIEVWKNSTNDDSDNVNVQRFVSPPAGLDADMTSRWQKVSGRAFPYNKVARYENDMMKIDAVVAPEANGSATPAVLYTAFFGVGRNESQEFMKGKLDQLTTGMRVTEH